MGAGILLDGPRTFYEFYKFGYRCSTCGTFISGYSISRDAEPWVMCSEHYPVVRKSHVCEYGHDNFESFFGDSAVARMKELLEEVKNPRRLTWK